MNVTVIAKRLATIYRDSSLDEQWYVDLERKQLYCYIGDEVEITKTYDTFEALVADVNFDSLIGESDGYIHDNKAYFERRY